MNLKMRPEAVAGLKRFLVNYFLVMWLVQIAWNVGFNVYAAWATGVRFYPELVDWSSSETWVAFFLVAGGMVFGGLLYVAIGATLAFRIVPKSKQAIVVAVIGLTTNRYKGMEFRPIFECPVGLQAGEKLTGMFTDYRVLLFETGSGTQLCALSAANISPQNCVARFDIHAKKLSDRLLGKGSGSPSFQYFCEVYGKWRRFE